MIKRIFIDLDDVLNTFTMAALKYVGCPVNPTDYTVYPQECGFRIVDAANLLRFGKSYPFRNAIFSERLFWGMLHPVFWETIPLSRALAWLPNLCGDLVGRRNVCILTSTPARVGFHVASAKVVWMRNRLPYWLRDQYLIGVDKSFCASPESLLIDDHPESVISFRKANGFAITFPRPWNDFYSSDPRKHVCSELDRLVFTKAIAA